MVSMEASKILPDGSEKLPLSQEIRSTLEQIDFEELEQIAKKDLVRCGINPDYIAPIRIGNISAEPSNFTKGSFNKVGGEAWITISNKYINRTAFLRRLTKHFPLQTRAPESEILTILSHEIAHSVSGTTHEDYQSGYGRIYREHAVMLFRFFNEAVTDRIGEEIYNEYLHARRLVHRLPRGDAEIKPGTYVQSDEAGVRILELLIERIARETKVPQDITWKAIKRGYYEALELRSAEVKDLLSETLSSEIFQQLHQVDDGFGKPKSGQLTRRLLFNKWTSSLTERWGKFVAPHGPEPEEVPASV